MRKSLKIKHIMGIREKSPKVEVFMTEETDPNLETTSTEKDPDPSLIFRKEKSLLKMKTKKQDHSIEIQIKEDTEKEETEVGPGASIKKRIDIKTTKNTTIGETEVEEKDDDTTIR